MILCDRNIITVDKFGDKASHIKYTDTWEGKLNCNISWFYEGDEELFTLICLTKHLREVCGKENITLDLYYAPHARMDRVENDSTVFTLKYFCEVINSLQFKLVTVCDPHSDVVKALLDRVNVTSPELYITEVILSVKDENPVIFFPDAGSMKRYAGMIGAKYPMAYGKKVRDWNTGKISKYELCADLDFNGKTVIIIDDICSYGTTFKYAAEELKKAGASKVVLYVTHLENAVLKGKLFCHDNNGMPTDIDHRYVDIIYTTNSLFTERHKDIRVMIPFYKGE